MLPPETMAPTRRPRNRSGWARIAASAAAARALHDQLLDLRHKHDRAFDLAFPGQHDLRARGGDDGSGRLSGTLDRDPLGQGVGAGLDRGSAQRRQHRRAAGRLDSDDLDPGIELPRRDDAPGDEPPAADRNDERVEVGRGLQHLQRDRALTRDHPGILIGVDQGESPGPRLRIGEDRGFREVVSLQRDRGAQRLGVGDLLERGVPRHHDRCRDAERLRVAGDRLRVVARGHRDHPGKPFRFRQAQQAIEGPALLEGGCVMQVLQLEADMRSQHLRQLRRVDRRRFDHPVRDRRGGRLHIVEDDRHRRGSRMRRLAASAEPAAMGPMVRNTPSRHSGVRSL